MHARITQKVLRVLIVLLVVLVSFGSTPLAAAQSTSQALNSAVDTGQPVLLKDINSAGGSDPSTGIVTNVGGANIRYFAAADDSHGYELWRTDGTSAGTKMVKDINPGPEAGVYPFSEMVEVNGILYFNAYDPNSGDSLWRSDGTSAGTWLVRVPNPNEMLTEFREFTAVGNKLFFLHFSAGQEMLWVSDGTTPGTQMLKAIDPDAQMVYDDRLVALGNLLILSHDTGPFEDWSFELWRSDGTANGTQRFIGPNTTSDQCGNLFEKAVFGGKAYFSMCDSALPDSGQQLWQTDGTTNGTKKITATAPDTYSEPQFMTQVGSTLYFTANVFRSGTFYEQPSVWKLLLGSMNASMVSPFWNFAPVGMQILNPTTLIFLGRDTYNNDSQWRTLDINTREINDFCIDDPCYPTDIQEYAMWRGKIYFSATDGDVYNLWVTDGTSTGTNQVLDPSTGLGFTNPGSFLSAGTNFFFTPDDVRYGRESWVMHIEMNNQLYLPSVRR